MSEWQPIETAPKDGTEILAYSSCPRPYYALVEWFDGAWCMTPEFVSTGNELTHWMHLPEPPEE